jgi:hypothetical protein
VRGSGSSCSQPVVRETAVVKRRRRERTRSPGPRLPPGRAGRQGRVSAHGSAARAGDDFGQLAAGKEPLDAGRGSTWSRTRPRRGSAPASPHDVVAGTILAARPSAQHFNADRPPNSGRISGWTTLCVPDRPLRTRRSRTRGSARGGCATPPSRMFRRPCGRGAIV